jgi:excisionase family DNA binding protein
MRVGEAAEYLEMSVVGVRKAAEPGRLPCPRSASGQRLFDRADLDAYLGRPVPVADAGGRERVEALYCRVSGSTGPESSLAIQERMLRDTA